MQLLIIIIQEVDYERLSREFIRHRILATKFCTEGLYLNKKNITLMVCIEKEREKEILEYIKNSCTERVEERQVSEYNGQMFVDTLKGVKVGGATVFTADVDTEILILGFSFRSGNRLNRTAQGMACRRQHGMPFLLSISVT